MNRFFSLLVVFCAITLNAWDGVLPLNGWRANYSGKNAGMKEGKFSGTPRDAGASLSWDFDPPVALSQFNRMELQLDGQLNATDLGLSIRGTKNIHVKAIAGEKSGVFFFDFEEPPDPIKQLRIYFNMKKRFTEQTIDFVIIKAVFTRIPTKEPLTALPWAEHQQMFDRTWIFPRLQAKYDLMKNYLGAYSLGSGTFNDRPLFFDRTLAGIPLPLYNKLGTPEGFRRQLDSALEFVDGFGLFAMPRRPARFLDPVRYADEKGLKNVILLEITPVWLSLHAPMKEIIDKALASPAVFKFDGKLVIGCYHGETLTPDQWKEALAHYRAKFPGKLLFFCELRGLAYQICADFKRGNGQIPKRKIEEYKVHARRYLDVVDGINFSGSNHITASKPGFPEHVFNAEAYEKFIVPLFTAVVNEPQYKGRKLLGLSAHKAYCQVRKTSSNVDEEGTLALRRSLATALAAKPDLIVMPEWNEVNENTHVEPVVSDAKATVRIVNAIRGRKTTDVERRYPNFILSFRQENELGAPIPIELLGLPDPDGEPYSVVLKLMSPDGKLLKRFPSRRFSHRKIESTFHLEPAAQFAAHRYLVVLLEVTRDGKTVVIKSGLPHIRLVAPSNIYHRYVKIPLRDLPDPEKITAEFKFTDEGVEVAGRVECPELINSVELMADDVPLAAIDPRNEFTPPQGYELLAWIRQTPCTTGYARDTVIVTAIKGKIMVRTPHQYGLSGMKTPRQDGQRLVGAIGGGAGVREFFFYATPDAKLKIEQRGEKATVRVADVLKYRRWRQCASLGVSWQLVAFDQQPEMPFPLDVHKLDYTLSAPLSTRPNPVYYLRVVTREGRVFRSEPAMLAVDYKPTVEMPIWDLTTKRAKNITVPTALARDVVYDFDPRLNHLLPARDGCRDYDGILGGFDYWTHSAPGWNIIHPPTWNCTDGRWTLDFKPGDAILIPPPLFSKSAFTIEMEFRLNDVNDQILLNVIYNQLPVRVRDGNLFGAIVTRDGRHEWSAARKLVSGRWYEFKISYDLTHLTVFVDDVEEAKIACSNLIKDGWVLGIGGVPLNNRRIKQNFLGDAGISTDPDSGFNFNGSLRALRVRNF